MISTTQEAIETLRANYPDACFEQLRCAVDMAINALTAQEKIQELSNDSPEVDKENGELISRQMAIQRCNTCKHEKDQWFNRCADCFDYELWEENEDGT